MSKTRLDLNGRTILVTGSPGFIGANLVMRLRRELTSGTVISFDNMNDYYDPALKDQIRITVVATGYPEADAYVGNEPVLAQRSSVPVRTQASSLNNTNRIYSAPETVVRQAVPVTAAAPASDSSSFLNRGRKESKLDIPPFLKMKSRD